MPVSHPSPPWLYNPRATRKQNRFHPYWRTFLCRVTKTLIDSQPYIQRSYDECSKILQWTLWKHRFSPIDTSNALAWLTIPAYYVVPQRTCINELPIEILTKIFAYVLHSDSRAPKDRFCHEISRRISSGSSPTTPLVITSVSRFWREVVHNTPTLWSTIKVLCPITTDVEYVSFLLGKSENCPLTLSLEQYTTPDPASLAIAKLFVSQSRRWKSVTFTLFRCIQDAFSALQPGDVGLLEDYRVHIDSWDSDRIENFVQILHSSTNLQRIDWGKSLSGNMKTELPWSRLSEITLYCMELSQSTLTALSQCESLKTLKMRRIQRPYVDIPSPVTLNQLERLVCDRPESFEAVFDSLTLPTLSDLEVTDRNELLKSDIIALKHLLVRSRFLLKTLSIDGHSMDILLSIAPFLTVTTTLNILSDIMKDFRCLKKPEGAARADILPSLRNLILHNCWAADGTLAEVVWSRRDELLEIQVCMYIVKAPRDYMTLGWLAKDGVLVSIHEPVSRFSTFYFQGNPRDPDSDVVPMIHFPDPDTLW